MTAFNFFIHCLAEVPDESVFERLKESLIRNCPDSMAVFFSPPHPIYKNLLSGMISSPSESFEIELHTIRKLTPKINYLFKQMAKEYATEIAQIRYVVPEQRVTIKRGDEQ